MVDGGEREKPSSYSLLWQAREVLLELPAWIEYAQKVYSIDPEGHPFLSYIGLNFTENSLKNYKFYFSFFKRLSPEEIAMLLPVPNRGRFDELYEQWHPSKEYNAMHRGTTFAIKVEADGTPTYYYHLRLKGLPFGAPERMTLRETDRDNYHGVCEEFTGEKIHLKKYWYLTDPRSIAESLAVCGLPDRTANIPMLEYIESEGRDKFDWITADDVLLKAILDRGQPRLASGLAKIKNDCGFEIFGPGTSREGTDHAVYFIENKGPLYAWGYIFDGVRTFAKRHLRLARFPER